MDPDKWWWVTPAILLVIIFVIGAVVAWAACRMDGGC